MPKFGFSSRLVRQGSGNPLPFPEVKVLVHHDSRRSRQLKYSTSRASGRSHLLPAGLQVTDFVTTHPSIVDIQLHFGHVYPKRAAIR